jgi:hypothetical protein
MSSPDYVWEKLLVAIDCMCGDGDFIQRMKSATISALMRLEESDLDGALGDDLAYILEWTKHNLRDGMIQKLPDELERKKLIEKMMHVMLETYKK